MAVDGFVAAVVAGDLAVVERELARDPSMAGSRDGAGVSVLMLARYHGRREVAEAIHDAGQPLDVFEAATFGDGHRLRELLAADAASAQSWSVDGFTPLHFAAFFGGPEVATELIAAGADVDAVARNPMRVAPVHSAAAGKLAVLPLLIAAGADLDARQHGGWTALHEVAQRGEAALADALIAAGADPAARNDAGLTPAGSAAAAGHAELAARLATRATSSA